MCVCTQLHSPLLYCNRYLKQRGQSMVLRMPRLLLFSSCLFYRVDLFCFYLFILFKFISIPCFASQMFPSIYLAVLCWIITATVSHGSSFFLVPRGQPCRVSGSCLATVNDVSTRNKQTACAVMATWAITHLKDGTMSGSGK